MQCRDAKKRGFPAEFWFTFPAKSSHPSVTDLGDIMRRFFTAAGLCLALSLPAGAQTTRGPAELPPADFEGREYTDSQGCVFLRSTFGGEVTWVPRFGPDRQPVCNGTEEVAAQSADDDTTPNATDDAAQPEEQQQVAEQPVPQPAGSNASQIAPIAPTAKAPAPRPLAGGGRPRHTRGSCRPRSTCRGGCPCGASTRPLQQRRGS